MSKQQTASSIVSGGRPLRVRARWVWVILLVAVIAAGVVAYEYYSKQQSTQKTDDIVAEKAKAGDLRAKRAQELQQQPVPSDSADRISYYSLLATNLAYLSQHGAAAEAFEEAQLATEEANQTDLFRFYINIADEYKAAGNKPKAKQYYQKEIDWLKLHPGDEPETTQEAITALQKELNAL